MAVRSLLAAALLIECAFAAPLPAFSVPNDDSTSASAALTAADTTAFVFGYPGVTALVMPEVSAVAAVPTLDTTNGNGLPSPQDPQAAAVSATTAVSTTDSPAQPITAMVNTVNTNQVFDDLLNSAATSLYNGNPGDLIKTGIKILLSLFGFPTGNGPSVDADLKAFQKDVDTHLTMLAQDLAGMSSTLNTILQSTSRIDIDVQDAHLDDILQMMSEKSAIIDTAFSTFVAYTTALADSNTAPAVRDQAYAGLYDMLVSKSSIYSATSVLNAINQYHGHVLGDGAAQGVLSFVPQMVHNGWQQCASDLPTAAPTQFLSKHGYKANVGLYGTDGSGQGPWYDSVDYIFNQCVNQTYTQLQSPSGRSVQNVFGAIMSVEVKAFTILNAAFANDTLVGALYLQQVGANIQRTGSAMANLWSAIAAPSTIDAAGAALLNTYGAQLGIARADVSAWTKSANGDPSWPARPQDGSILPTMITTLCDRYENNLFPNQLIMGDDTIVACFIQTSGPLSFAPDQDYTTVNAVAMTFMGQQYTDTLQSNVLAPICTCRGTEQCGPQDCPGGTFISFSNTDVNGHRCDDTFNSHVPVCRTMIPGKFEYQYQPVSGDKIPAPHTFIPQPPQFMQTLISTYAPYA